MSWLTAAEALAVLQTKPQTLYANVSRGRIQAKPLPEDPRRSLYRAEDVQRLAERKPGRKRESAIAAETIRWGMPIMRSAISTVTDGQLLYRGRDAVQFSELATLEDAVRLLWHANDDLIASPLPSIGGQDNQTVEKPMEKLFVAFGKHAANDLPGMGRSPAILQREAFGLLQLFYDIVLGSDTHDLLLHERIARTWNCPQASDLIRRILVLLADHELNASAFAVRVAASTGAPLSSAVLAGLATLIGPQHGRAAIFTQTMIANMQEMSAADTIRVRLQQGLPMHPFGHPLYRDTGDIRANALLTHIELPAPYLELKQAAAELLGEAPNIDFVLAAMTDIHNLPEDAPLLLFALARIAGWLAHALEQSESGVLIRPRAEFIPPIG